MTSKWLTKYLPHINKNEKGKEDFFFVPKTTTLWTWETNSNKYLNKYSYCIYLISDTDGNRIPS